MDKVQSISDLKKDIKSFIRERNWEKSHSPKNISMSLSIEAAELMELYQWISTAESWDLHRKEDNHQKIVEEIADVAIYLIDLCNVLDIDLSDEIKERLELNAKRYPVDSSKLVL